MRDMRTILCTREREKMCVIVIQHATVSLLRLHARYTRDTHSIRCLGDNVEKIPDEPAIEGESGHHEKSGKLENVTLRHMRDRRSSVHDALSRDNRYAETLLI